MGLSKITEIGELPVNGFETLTIADASTALTNALANACRAVFITVEDASIRYRADGTDPDANTGHLLEEGDRLLLSSRTSALRLRMIRSGGVSGTVMVSYYG